ncbi:MAG: hypothetical protein [Caudoviricetes sp.]|nr:MAG: hypothetical protein [Caudoviricetes sp.]
MAMYKVVIEAPGLQEEFEFEADTPEDAEETGRDMFFDVCNYGVHKISEDE